MNMTPKHAASSRSAFRRERDPAADGGGQMPGTAPHARDPGEPGATSFSEAWRSFSCWSVPGPATSGPAPSLAGIPRQPVRLRSSSGDRSCAALAHDGLGRIDDGGSGKSGRSGKYAASTDREHHQGHDGVRRAHGSPPLMPAPPARPYPSMRRPLLRISRDWPPSSRWWRWPPERASPSSRHSRGSSFLQGTTSPSSSRTGMPGAPTRSSPR